MNTLSVGLSVLLLAVVGFIHNLLEPLGFENLPAHSISAICNHADEAELQKNKLNRSSISSSRARLIWV